MKRIILIVACITIVSSWNLASAEVTVDDLHQAYDKYCKASWADLLDNGYSLSIDTNPYNRDDYYDYEADQAVSEINRFFGLPESVNTDIGNTSAKMGVQTFTKDNLTLSWTYYPDNGLEIWYSLEKPNETVHTREEIKDIYAAYCQETWASVSNDGTLLSIDTNPHDSDSGADNNAIEAVEKINAAFGLSESINIRMSQTSGLMGIQTAEDGNLSISWTYHPSNGLEVIYSINESRQIEHTASELIGVYKEYCDPYWAVLSDDRCSLYIDTNPHDIDDYMDYTAYETIEKINAALGLPEVVYVQMGRTTSLQGLVTYNSGNMTVSWTYHPDKGMELEYRIENETPIASSIINILDMQQLR